MGDGALVSNATGQLKLVVTIANTLQRGVVLVSKGRWPKEESQGININVLNPGMKTDMGESSAVHGIEVMVTRVES
jgi:hypothetical protein